MGGHAEARHIDADDTDTIDDVRQQLQRHARCCWHTEIGDDDGIVQRRIRQLVHGVANILEQLAGDERFRVERYVTDGATGAVEMRGEGQAIDAAGRAGEHGRGAAHAQADTQRTECGAHGLRLVVRTLGIVCSVTIEHFGLAGLGRSIAHGLGTSMAPSTFRHRRSIGKRHRPGFKIERLRHCRRQPPAKAWSRTRRRAYRPG